MFPRYLVGKLQPCTKLDTYTYITCINSLLLWKRLNYYDRRLKFEYFYWDIPNLLGLYQFSQEPSVVKLILACKRKNLRLFSLDITMLNLHWNNSISIISEFCLNIINEKPHYNNGYAWTLRIKNYIYFSSRIVVYFELEQDKKICSCSWS